MLEVTTCFYYHKLSYMYYNAMLRFWQIWFSALVLVSIALFSLMDVAPSLHGDEFMIVDLGRVILQPDSNWSITWMTDRNEPAFVFFYLGPVLQELAFQAVGQYGPRVSGVLGAFVAATALVGLLLARDTSRAAALMLGLAFLLDPIFLQAYTLGRVDGWAMATCLISCWILRKAAGERDAATNRRVAAAGAGSALAFFIWPSAVFLLPLILLELVRMTTKVQSVQFYSKAFFISIAIFTLSGIITTVLLVVPVASKFYHLFWNIVDGFIINMQSGPSNAKGAGTGAVYQSTLSLFQTLKFTPFIVLFGLLGIYIRRDVGVICAGVTATLIMVLTLVYMHRVQYLIPYFIIIIAGIFERGYDYKHSFKSTISIATKLNMILVISWSIVISIVARSILAFDEKVNRKRELIYQAAMTMIGYGKHAVCIPGPEFYYAGRSLGWEMYKPYAAVGDTLSTDKLKGIITHIDYLILPSWEEAEEFDCLLLKEGMEGYQWFYLYPEQITDFDGKTTNIYRIRNLFSIFRQPYGPYILYKREKAKYISGFFDNQYVENLDKVNGTSYLKKVIW